MATTTADTTAGTTQARPSVEIPSKRITASQIESLSKRVVCGGDREMNEVEQPFTGRPLGWTPKSTPEDVEAAFERAREAQRAWKQTSFDERRAILLRFHDLVMERQDELLDLLQIEGGKARRHAYEEALDVAIVARYYANTAETHLKTKRRRGVIPFLTATWEYHHPLGVIGLIAPWNYPITLSVSDAVPAIAAGNGVVCKPDTQTPFSALWGFALLEEAGLPKGLVQVVTGSGSELGPEIIDRADYMMFTGSTGVGRTVAEQSGKNLIGSSMELGGKNAMIVLDDANMSRTLEGAERALFSNSGQLCISVERLFVHDSIADEFTQKLAERTRKMKLGTTLDYSSDMGSLISETQLETVTDHVKDAIEKGAQVLAGGKARPDIGPYFHEPTLLERVKDGMTLFRDETFGPVVAVSRFSDLEEVVQRANDSDYGLNFSVWTKNTRRGRELATRLEAGTVNVNEGYVATWASVDAPMGGMKASGLGRRHGAVGIQKYTESQTVSVQRVIPIAPPFGVPQALWAKAMNIGLRLLRYLPGTR
jgi:succinate-semialdehyde dehydrogenase/glutarate-semialdehyde dehydrogenase